MKNLKAVQITYLGKPLHQVYPHASWFQVLKYRTFRAVRWFAIRFAIGMAGTALLAGGYVYASITAPELKAINVMAPVTIKDLAPILHRIALAESGDKQFGRDGQVIIHINNNGTYDQGRFQVNSTWNKIATKMGYNLSNEKDNEAFAIFLFETYGSEPWSASKSTWNK